MNDSSTTAHNHQLLALAIQGDREALGRLLMTHRSYLTVLARAQIHRQLQGKPMPLISSKKHVWQRITNWLASAEALPPNSPAGFVGFSRINWPNMSATTGEHSEETSV